MKILLTLLTILISINCLGQNKVYDTSIIIGKVKEQVFADSIFDEAISGRLFNEGDLVIITGIDYEKNKGKVYQGDYNGKNYYFPEKSLFIKNHNYDDFSSMDDTTADLFYKHSKYISASVTYNNTVKAVNFIKSTASKGIAILDFSVYEVSEGIDVTGFKFQIFNPTKKTIKYITLSIVGYNSVDDKVKILSNKYIKEVKGIGPIKPGEQSTYSFDYIWFTNIVQYAKILSIKVQYMDGSIKIINNIKSVLVPSAYFEILNT